MVGRRWVWTGAAVIAALWMVRAARAESPVQDPPVPGATVRESAAAATPPAAAAPAAKAAKPAASAPVQAKRPAFAGYAAESAKTATRLPPEEREARAFLRAAAQASRFEAEASRLAATRAHGDPVRAYAAELLQYQDGAGVELLHLLHARGMALPMMEAPQRKALQRLGKLSGAKFDREFMELLGSRQQRQDLLQYERAVAGTADPVLRAWIEKQLPSLRAQQDAAARLRPAEARRVEGIRQTALAPAPGLSARKPSSP